MICTQVFIGYGGRYHIPCEETCEDWGVVKSGAWKVERAEDVREFPGWTAVYRVERRGRVFHYLVDEGEGRIGA